jgi:selenide,water dikinase
MLQIARYPIVKDLVLLGGGHSHAIALKHLAMNAIAGLQITLLSDCIDTPYSGMLPGHVAGFYDHEDAHIDLYSLAQRAGTRFYHGRAIGLDLEQNRILCRDRPPVQFDLLSIDIGSTPQAATVPGAADHAIPAKPVPQFLAAWHTLLDAVRRQPEKQWRLVIVGGGAGGVELAINVEARLRQILPTTQFQITVLHRGDRLMTGHHPRVARLITTVLKERRIEVQCDQTVVEVERQRVRCASGLTVDCDRTVWVTQAAPPDWIGASGLHTDERGFILVHDTLQSLSHPQVFAAGDIATIARHPRPKAGVFAVRQGLPLVQNLRRALQGEPLKPYNPQKTYLALIGTGDREAIASWGPFSGRSSWFWRWKDRIDRAFMAQFRDLPPMLSPPKTALPLPPHHPTMYCSGCGSKVGATVLQTALQRLQIPPHPAVLVGLNAPDDAAISRIPPKTHLVQTLDHFTSPITDPYQFGTIMVNHCLSDLWAMGATPQTVLAGVTLPYGVASVTAETLYQVLAGVVAALKPTGATLVGGHTTEGDRLTLSLTSQGYIAPNTALRTQGLQDGDVLILTKAIGTGTLFAASERGRAPGRWIAAMVAAMTQSNQAAVPILRQWGATACTDISGFGLVGHLLEMLAHSDLGVMLNGAAIPCLEGAQQTINQGLTSSLQGQNLTAAPRVAGSPTAPIYPLLFDPQTAGGLLVAMPRDRASDCLAALRHAGYEQAGAIAQVVPRRELTAPIQLI